MADVTLLGALWFLITAIVAAMMWAAQIGPKAAASNLSDWATWFGLTPPQWLRSPEADRIVRRGGPLTLAVLAVAGVWIFFSLETAIYTVCIELIGFALFALRRRSRSLGIALIIISFISLGVGLWIVISAKPESIGRNIAVAAAQPGATPSVPATGNPLLDKINEFLSRNGKTAELSRHEGLVQIGDENNGKGPFITYWDSSLGAWPEPTTSSGFSANQLRRFPQKVPRFTTSFDKEKFRGALDDLSTTINKINPIYTISTYLVNRFPFIDPIAEMSLAKVVEQTKQIKEMSADLDRAFFADSGAKFFGKYRPYAAELSGTLPEGWQTVFTNYKTELRSFVNAVALIEDAEKHADNPDLRAHAAQNVEPTQLRFWQAVSALRDMMVDCNRRIDMMARAI
jgi:hypothetical protein